MQSSNIPTKIPLPFAYNAGSGYKNTIPTASQIGIVNGRASLNDGFPPLNFVPISSGGVPPFGSDVNGILNEITAITQWQQAGGFFFYDSSFSTTIGGYPKGAILQSSSNSGLWISTAENNTTNPDTGGAGWMSLAFEGSQAITVTTADVTVTQLQSAYPVLIISGALTAARSLIMPAIVGEWIVQNNTTGAFNLTVKTASGTGVVATQSQSTFLYGDGSNILFADSSKVASFNGRVGTVTLNATDVTTALGYTPIGPNLTGAVTSIGNTTSLGSFTSAQLATALTDETGTGANVFANNPSLSSPTFTTPILGTPSSGNLANCSFPTLNQNTTGNAATATNATNASYSSTQAVGTNNTTIATTAFSNSLVNSKAIGIGQTWHSLTSSRSMGTTYTNNNGRPMQVAILFYLSNSSQAYFYIDGVIMINHTVPSPLPLCFIIPTGSTYNYTVVAGGGTLQNWNELY